MSQSAMHARAFYKEVASQKAVWTIKDSNGYPAPMTNTGKRSQPFWSSEKRAKLIIATTEAYSGFIIVKIDWEEFKNKWIANFENDGILIGVNWSGKMAIGYDIEPSKVVKYVEGQKNE